VEVWRLGRLVGTAEESATAQANHASVVAQVLLEPMLYFLKIFSPQKWRKNGDFLTQNAAK
jgi:hypothetical protein